jgi:hypothetical protein
MQIRVTRICLLSRGDADAGKVLSSYFYIEIQVLNKWAGERIGAK